MPGSKRLTYQTGDGKRHWVRSYALAPPEGVQFLPAQEAIERRNHSSECAAKPSHAHEIEEMEPAQPPAVDDKPDKRQRSTIRLE